MTKVSAGVHNGAAIRPLNFGKADRNQDTRVQIQESRSQPQFVSTTYFCFTFSHTFFSKLKSQWSVIYTGSECYTEFSSSCLAFSMMISALVSGTLTVRFRRFIALQNNKTPTTATEPPAKMVTVLSAQYYFSMKLK